MCYIRTKHAEIEKLLSGVLFAFRSKGYFYESLELLLNIEVRLFRTKVCNTYSFFQVSFSYLEKDTNFIVLFNL